MIVYPRTPESQQLMISFAQNWEDVLIDRVFRKQAGFYIDVGAFSPMLDSVTKYFSLIGWRGINIEPVAECHAEMVKDRPGDINLRCAAGRTRGTAGFHLLASRGLSTMSRAQLAMLPQHQRKGEELIQVEVRTLADICAEHVTGEIDFLKIDAEGAEGDIIAGADWQRYRPRLLVIESTKPNSSELICAEWEPELLANGYLFQCFDGINRYYLRKEDAHLAEQLSVPANILDFFTTNREVAMNAEINAARETILRYQSKPSPPAVSFTFGQ